MELFIIKKGTSIIAAKKRENGMLDVEVKKTKRDAQYFFDDLVIDPLNPKGSIAERHFAVQGFFGFQLPPNKRGYDLLIVHSKNLLLENL